MAYRRSCAQPARLEKAGSLQIQASHASQVMATSFSGLSRVVRDFLAPSSRRPNSAARPGVESPDAVASSIDEKFARFSFSMLFILTSRPRSIDRTPVICEKGEASPTGTFAHDLESLPYQPSGLTTAVISRVASKSEGATSTREQPVLPRAKTRLWASFIVYVCIGWSDGGATSHYPILFAVLLTPVFARLSHRDYPAPLSSGFESELH